MRAHEVPPHAYFVVSAVFHYLGPSFAVLLFARVDVLGVAWLRIAVGRADLRLLAPPLARAARAGPRRPAAAAGLGRGARADELLLLPRDRPPAAWRPLRRSSSCRSSCSRRSACARRRNLAALRSSDVALHGSAAHSLQLTTNSLDDGRQLDECRGHGRRSGAPLQPFLDARDRPAPGGPARHCRTRSPRRV